MTTLTDAERLILARERAEIALCQLPPAVPGAEFTDEACGTVWRTSPSGRGGWEWLIAFEPEACPHDGTVTRYDDGTVDCDECSERLVDGVVA